MEKIEISGLYIISDQYYLDYPNNRYMQNKSESRPHYYAIQDNDGIFWMIPLSSKVEKYRAKIAQMEQTYGHGSCILYCIAPIHGTERAILVGDMFPITEKYILRPYTIDGQPYVIRNKNIRKMIRSKAMRYLSLVKRGVLKSPLDILTLKNALLQNERENDSVSQ